MVDKTIVLLANSRKHGGRCLAGRELLPGYKWGNWVRPVSSREGEELSLEERRYSNGGDPLVLDVIKVPLIAANPHACHIENWLVSPHDWWEKTGHLPWEQAANLSETPPILWVNGHSTFLGLQDKIPGTLSAELKSSICMIRVTTVTIEVLKGYSGEKKIFASFRHGGVKYRLPVTDSVFESQFKSHPLDHEEDFGESLLTISLSEPFEKQDGARFKLVAALIPK